MPINSNRIKACRRRRATLNVSATVRPQHWSVWDLKMSACDSSAPFGRSELSAASDTPSSPAPVIHFQVCAESFHYEQRFPSAYLPSAAYRQSARARLKTKLRLCAMQPRHLQNANSLSESKRRGGSEGATACGNTDKSEYPFHGTPAPRGSTAASTAYHTISCI